MQFLEELFGEEWVQSVVLSPDSRHPLALWHGKGVNNPIGNYTNELAEFILSGGFVTCDVPQLANKLKANFVETLVEIGYAVFLGKQKLRVTMEPFAPRKGPDLAASHDRREYFVEIKKVNLDEARAAADSAAIEVFSRLRGKQSRFRVLISMTPEFAAYSPQLKRAARAVEQLLETLPAKQATKATLCYWGSDEQRLIQGDADAKLDYTDAANLRAQIHLTEQLRNAPFVAQFDDTGIDNDHTAIAVHTRHGDPLIPKPDETHLRLRGILHDKCDQLPKGACGIIVLELTELKKIGIHHFTLLSALYGDLQLTITRQTEEQRYESAVSHQRNGFFGQTSRVSAVVVEQIRIDTSVEVSREVFPTNNVKAVLLTKAELECFGAVVEDLKHLCRAV